MAIKNDAAAEAAEFSALLAEMEAEDSAPAAPAKAAPAEAEPEAEEALEEAEEPEAAEPAPGSADADELRASVAALLDVGDIKAAAEALGVDPKIFGVNNRQFTASRKLAADAKRDREEAEAKAAAAEQRAQAAEALNRAAQNEYGVVAAGSKAYREGDLSQVRAAIEVMCKDSFENVVAKLARAAKGLDPGQVEVAKLRRELAERDAAQAAQAAAQTAAAEEAAQVTEISTRLKGTPLEGVDGAAGEIFAVLKKSLHPTLRKYTKTLKEAYVEVAAAKKRQAEQLAKLVTRQPAAKPTPSRAPLATGRAPIAGTRSGPPKRLTPEEEFQAELKAAERETEAQARKLRRVK